jgi:hypothetical protein
MNINNHYIDHTIILDGNEFRNCIFTNCEMQFLAAAPFVLVDCVLQGCTWSLKDGARATLEVLRILYNASPEEKKFVEEQITWIRSPIESAEFVAQEKGE